MQIMISTRQFHPWIALLAYPLTATVFPQVPFVFFFFPHRLAPGRGVPLPHVWWDASSLVARVFLGSASAPARLIILYSSLVMIVIISSKLSVDLVSAFLADVFCMWRVLRPGAATDE